MSSSLEHKKPELSLGAMRTPLNYIEKRFGPEKLRDFLGQTGMDRGYLQDHNNWISFEYAHRIFRTLVDLAGDERVCLEAGTQVFSPEAIGRAAWFAIKALGTPSMVYRRIFDLAHVYNRVGRFRILSLKENRLVLEYRPIEGYREKDKCFCDYRIGNFIAVPTIWGQPPARCRELSCNANGDDTCTYEFTWQTRNSLLYPLAGCAAGALLTSAYVSFLSPAFDLHLAIPGFLFPLSGTLAGWLTGFKRALKKNEGIYREQQVALEASLESVSDKYVELQESNRALAEAHSELTLHKEHLEELVGERTHELQESKAKLEESYEKLQELDRMKMSFFNNVSHELRTPLALTLGPVEAMLQGELGPLQPQQQDYLLNIHTNSLRLLKLINNLLDLAKMEDGKMSLEMGTHDLAAFLRQVVGSFAVTAEKRAIDLSIEGGPRKLLVCFDRDKLEKVLINLIGNALKFTPSPGSIVIRWQQEETLARFQVLDTGPGVPEEALGKIFDRFEQGDGSLGRKYGGTGLGLALVKEIVELHGGKVEAGNRPEGGAVFSFTLPFREAPAAEEETESPEEERGWANQLFRQAAYVEDVERAVHRPQGEAEAGLEEPLPEETGDGRPLVLVVEDNPDMRRFTTDCLRKEFRVFAAVDGRDGLEKIRRRLPELVVSDIMMPNMTGYELTAAVKQSESLRHTPILLLSSKSEADMKVQGFEKGADDYLTKPYNPRELLARAKNMIRLKNLEKEVRNRNLELEQALRELKEAQVKLIHSEKMASLGVLSAGLVHEINNPLNASISSIRTLLRSYARWQEGKIAQEEFNEKLQRASDRSLQGLTRCEQIVTGLLRFSRKQSVGRADADIHEGLESTLNLIPRHSGKEVVFHRDYRFRDKVRCDLGQLNQVFMNLLVNAYQAVGPGGEVWIRTERRGGELAVTVEDNGSGIAPEALPHVFEPFYTTKEVGKGTGLGLSISHQIVQEHHGRIEVTSALGQGSSFCVLLPLHQRDAEGVTSAAASPGSGLLAGSAMC